MGATGPGKKNATESIHESSSHCWRGGHERRVSDGKRQQTLPKPQNRHAADTDQNEQSKKRDQFSVELKERCLLLEVLSLSGLTQMSMMY